MFFLRTHRTFFTLHMFDLSTSDKFFNKKLLNLLTTSVGKTGRTQLAGGGSLSALIVFIDGLKFSFKILFYVYLGDKTFFPYGTFFHMMWIKCLSKSPYSEKPSLTWKIPRCAPERVSWVRHWLYGHYTEPPWFC